MKACVVERFPYFQSMNLVLAKVTLLMGMICLFADLYSQSYTSYFTGNSVDAQVTPLGGVTLMGGATENDQAMQMEEMYLY